MAQEYQIFHFFQGRVFDAESYERTGLQSAFGRRNAGYYVVVSEQYSVNSIDLSTPDSQFIGPFADFGCARTAADELRRQPRATAARCLGEGGLD